MVVLEISNDYGYVLLAAASTVFVNIWHGTQTVKARKASRAVPSHWVDPPGATVSTKPASCNDPLTPHLHAKKGIGYPNTYATAEQAEKSPAAYQLNCAQRAHANFTENLTPYLTSLLIAGTRYPVQSAVMGAGWLLSRVVYTIGYTSSGPKGRMAGSIGHYLFGLSLALTACYTSVQMVRGA